MKKVVLITGISSGIGAATARVFAADSWYVIGVDTEEKGCPQEVHRFMQADVSDEVAIASLFESIQKEEERLDALVNNAAVQVCTTAKETSTEEWDRVFATNARSVFLAARRAQDLMKEGGAIVNVSSVHAVATSPAIAAYAASKGAVLSLTRSLALECAPGIRVNAVLPGAVDTPMLRAGVKRGKGNEKELLEALAKRHPLGRIGKPEEIAEAILFLADSERSSFVTGQSLIVDGGAIAHLSTE